MVLEGDGHIALYAQEWVVLVDLQFEHQLVVVEDGPLIELYVFGVEVGTRLERWQHAHQCLEFGVQLGPD